MKKIVLVCVAAFLFVGFTTSKRVEAIIKKEIKSIFNVESFVKEPLAVSTEINETLPIQITETNFFKIKSNEELIGYYYFGQAYGKADYFDFIVIFDKEQIVSKVKVVAYREDHGGEVGSKRWLRQFIGIATNKKLKYGDDIAGISGATISVKSMTNEVNKLLKSVQILADNEQL